jgi:exonuclease SbcC
MILKKITIRNIRSYDSFELEFPSGSILLSGDIGSGKTSILLAIQFALFGLQPGQRGASILRYGENSAYVSLELEVEGDKVVIERSLKKSKNSISQEANIISVNDEKKEFSTSEMKNFVINLLNYPKEFAKKSNLLYKFTVYTPQEEMKTIIQEKPETRLDTLRHIFGIDRYKRIKENSQIFIQKIKEMVKMKQGESSELNILKEKLKAQTEDKIKTSKEINNLNIEYQKLSEQKKQIQEKINSTQDLIEEKRKAESDLLKKQTETTGKKDFTGRIRKEIESMQKQIKEKPDFSQDRLDAVSNLLEKHKSLFDEFNEKLIEINSKISVLNSKKEQSLELKEKIQNMESRWGSFPYFVFFLLILMTALF